jgi:hypothetical protein
LKSGIWKLVDMRLLYPLDSPASKNGLSKMKCYNS